MRKLLLLAALALPALSACDAPSYEPPGPDKSFQSYSFWTNDLEIKQGETVEDSVWVFDSGNFDSIIQTSVTSSSPDLIVSVPATHNPRESTSVVVTITATESTPLGEYTVTLKGVGTGEGAGIDRQSSFKVTVVEAGSTPDPDPTPEPDPDPEPTTPTPNHPTFAHGFQPPCYAPYRIKGNLSSSGERIYHVPGGAYYDRTDPEVCFITEADARADGFRRSSR